MQIRQRALALFTSLTLVLALVAVPTSAGAATIQVGTEAALRAALTGTGATAAPGDIVQLTAPITITSGLAMTISKSGLNVTLDLNGQTITSKIPVTTAIGYVFTINNGASLTVIDSAGGGGITASARRGRIFQVTKGSLDLEAGTFTYAQDPALSPAAPTVGEIAILAMGQNDPSTVNYSHVTIGGTAKISNFSYAVAPGETSNGNAYGVVIDITGGSVNEGAYSVYTTGMLKGLGANAPQINISGGKLGGVYGAGYAHITMTGGDIVGVPYDAAQDPGWTGGNRNTGGSGVEIKAGTFDMSGGTITSTGPFGLFASSSGGSTLSAGISVVASSGYNTGSIEVNVTGGTISADDNGAAVAIVNDATKTSTGAPTGVNTPPATPASVNISGGDFNGPIINDSASTGIPYFISGGTFTPKSDHTAGNPSGSIDGWIDPSLGLNWFELSPGVYILGGAQLKAKFYDEAGVFLQGVADLASYSLDDAYDASTLPKPQAPAGCKWVVWPAMSSGPEAGTVSTDTLSADDPGAVLVAYLAVPSSVAPPVISDPVEGDTTISGTTTPGTTVAVTVNGGTPVDAVVDALGNWSVDVGALVAGDTIAAIATWVSPADADITVSSEAASVDVAALPVYISVTKSVNGVLSDPISLLASSTVADLGTVSVEGYSFKGWALDSAQGDVLVTSDELIDGQTYYAVLVKDEVPPVVPPKPLVPPLPPMGDNNQLPFISVLGLLIAGTALVALRRRSALLLNRK